MQHELFVLLEQSVFSSYSLFVEIISGVKLCHYYFNRCNVTVTISALSA